MLRASKYWRSCYPRADVEEIEDNGESVATSISCCCLSGFWRRNIVFADCNWERTSARSFRDEFVSLETYRPCPSSRILAWNNTTRDCAPPNIAIWFSEINYDDWRIEPRRSRRDRIRIFFRDAIDTQSSIEKNLARDFVSREGNNFRRRIRGSVRGVCVEPFDVTGLISGFASRDKRNFCRSGVPDVRVIVPKSKKREVLSPYRRINYIDFKSLLLIRIIRTFFLRSSAVIPLKEKPISRLIFLSISEFFEIAIVGKKREQKKTRFLNTQTYTFFILV